MLLNSKARWFFYIFKPKIWLIIKKPNLNIYLFSKLHLFRVLEDLVMALVK